MRVRSYMHPQRHPHSHTHTKTLTPRNLLPPPSSLHMRYIHIKTDSLPNPLSWMTHTHSSMPQTSSVVATWAETPTHPPNHSPTADTLRHNSHHLPLSPNARRSMPQTSSVVATWADTGHVHLWDVSSLVKAIDQPTCTMCMYVYAGCGGAILFVSGWRDRRAGRRGTTRAIKRGLGLYS